MAGARENGLGLCSTGSPIVVSVPEDLRLFQGVCKVQTIFITVLTCLTFSCSFSKKCIVAFSRSFMKCIDIVITANGIYVLCMLVV